MATYHEVLAALPAFRSDLRRRQQSEVAPAGLPGIHGAFAAFASPLRNVHANGVGLRVRGGRVVQGEYVLKLYVFDKTRSVPAAEFREYEGTPIDVESLPVQLVRSQRDRQRPIIGGVSIAPLNAPFVGTLGCFLRRVRLDGQELFALSNNHVLADVNRLAPGTLIVQPGPELPPFVTTAADAFGALHSFVPIVFPGSIGSPHPPNRFDAAIATVSDPALVQLGAQFGIARYDPTRVVPPVPGMDVIKCGRTTGVTRGIVVATGVSGTLVNYGTPQQPRITSFEDTVEIVNRDDPNQPFGMPGDSGSVILEEATGHPAALIFAGDGVHTTASELAPLCSLLSAWPA